MKNYIGFVNDHSGSMEYLTTAAMNDFNSNIEQIKNSATEYMLDTIVSVVSFGAKGGADIEKEIVISNPHVLKPKIDWKARGGTPLYDAIAELIYLFKSLPDANEPDVSFLLIITTDGQDEHSETYTTHSLQQLINSLDDRWTIVCRVPKYYPQAMENIGVPVGNIQVWNTTNTGLKESSDKTKQAINAYYTQRSEGKRSSNTFYTNVSNIDITKLEDITSKVSLYVVKDIHVPSDGRLQLQDFILKHRMNYLKGSAFYQLTKTEARLGHKKIILIRDRNTGKIYEGKLVREMLGLPTNSNARLHPGEHGNFDIFIQSESTNRLLVPNTGVIYWQDIGTQFTKAELDLYLGKTKSTKLDVVELPSVHGNTKPTPSPIPKANKRPMSFATRKLAREFAKANNMKVYDSNITGLNTTHRWYVA